MAPPDILSVKQAALVLDTSEATVKRLCTAGVLKAEKVGKEWQIDAGSLARHQARPARAQLPVDIDLQGALRRLREHDLRNDIYVPDVLRYRDYLGVPDDLIEAAASLINRSRPIPLPQQIDLPKSAFFTRPISLLDLDARLAYEALVETIVPRIEARLSPQVYGSRRLHPAQRGAVYRVNQWLAWRDDVRTAIQAGHGWMIKTDLTAFFEVIPHRLLFSDIDSLNPDRRVVEVLREMIRTWSTSGSVGIPQGPDASRMLAQLYLEPVDSEMLLGGWKYFRYMDDIRILGRNRAEVLDGWRALERECRRRGLVLSSHKSAMIPPGESIHEGEDLELNTAAYLFDRHAKSASYYLRALLRASLKNKGSLRISRARFSLWRLHLTGDRYLIPLVLRRIEDLAPVIELVVRYLRPAISKRYVERGITQFLEDDERNTSPVVTAWVLALCLDHPGPIPTSWSAYARRVASDRNGPGYLRAVALNLAARDNKHIPWIIRQIAMEHDPTILRALLVALHRAGASDRRLTDSIMSRSALISTTVQYLQGRRGLPSLIADNAEAPVTSKGRGR